MDEVTRSYLRSVLRGTEAEAATWVPCRGRWRDAKKLSALGLTPEREKDEQAGEEVALPDGLDPSPGGRVRIVARPGMGKTTLLLALHARLARVALAGASSVVPAGLVADGLRQHGWELTDEDAARLAGARRGRSRCRAGPRRFRRWPGWRRSSASSRPTSTPPGSPRSGGPRPRRRCFASRGLNTRTRSSFCDRYRPRIATL